MATWDIKNFCQIDEKNFLSQSAYFISKNMAGRILDYIVHASNLQDVSARYLMFRCNPYSQLKGICPSEARW
jgi:hypothetical protein